jgi:hypothetical protein
MWLIIGIAVFIGFGFLVDWIYKRKGINAIDPEENSKRISESERIYIESHMHNLKNNHQDNGGF